MVNYDKFDKIVEEDEKQVCRHPPDKSGTAPHTQHRRWRLL